MTHMVQDVCIPYLVVMDSIVDDCFHLYFMEAVKKFAYENNCRIFDLPQISYSVFTGKEWREIDKRPSTQKLKDLFLEIAPDDFILTIRMSTKYKENN
jgi:hypothetical protein